LDLVPRQGAHMVEPDTMSVVELYHVVITNKIYSYRIDCISCEHCISRNGKKEGSNTIRNSDEIWTSLERWPRRFISLRGAIQLLLFSFS